MGNVFFADWEVDFLVWLQSFSNGFTNAVSDFFTICGEEYVLILIVGLCFWCINKDLGHRVSLTMIGSMLFGTLIQNIFLRRRPYMDHDSIKCLRAPHDEGDIMSITDMGYSLPSLHSTMSVAAYGTIGLDTRKKATVLLAFLMPLGIGISRLFVGVHYPTDILAGWALGLVSIFLLSFLEKKLGYKLAFLIVLIVGCPGFFFCRDISFYSGFGVMLGLPLGFWFEEKCVKFEYTGKWWSYILRPIGGILAFLMVNVLLKLPLEALSLGDTALLYYRLFRYAVCSFVIMGLYPMVFKLCKNKI